VIEFKLILNFNCRWFPPKADQPLADKSIHAHHAQLVVVFFCILRGLMFDIAYRSCICLFNFDWIIANKKPPNGSFLVCRVVIELLF